MVESEQLLFSSASSSHAQPHVPGRLPEIVPLSALQRHHRGVVTHVDPSESSCHLQCLGFTEGGEVELVRTLSRGAVMIFRVDGADVALRRETAASIRIRTEL
jgi:Fe2+ transport system protein FeoA